MTGGASAVHGWLLAWLTFSDANALSAEVIRSRLNVTASNAIAAAPAVCQEDGSEYTSGLDCCNRIRLTRLRWSVWHLMAFELANIFIPFWLKGVCAAGTPWSLNPSM